MRLACLASQRPLRRVRSALEMRWGRTTAFAGQCWRRLDWEALPVAALEPRWNCAFQHEVWEVGQPAPRTSLERQA